MDLQLSVEEVSIPIAVHLHFAVSADELELLAVVLFTELLKALEEV